MKLNLDLKHKPMEMEKYDPKAPSYPSFNFSTEEDHSLPDEGVMTIRYKKVRSSEEERDGKVRYDCTVDVLKIVSATGGKGKAEADDDGDEHDEEEEMDEQPDKGGKKANRSPGVAAVLGGGEY